jgi:hypothetical protein
VSQPIIDDTHVDRPVVAGGAPFGEQEPVAPPPAPPSPANMPRPQSAPQPPSDPGDDDDGDTPKGKKLETVEDYQAEVERLRKENAKRRTKLKELEPLAQQAREAEEANKTELQREKERADAAEARDRQRQEDFDRLQVAISMGIEPDNIDLIGSGSREEMEAKAVRVAAMQQAQAGTTPPPSDRPVEGLRPGASPEPPKPADDSYPETWKPNHVRDQERAQYGQ